MSGRNRIRVAVSAALLASIGLTGCVRGPRLSAQAQRVLIDVDLDPSTYQLTGTTVLDLELAGSADLPADEPVSIEFKLHRDLKVLDVRVGGVEMVRRYSRRPARTKGHDQSVLPRTHVIVLAHPVDALSLHVDYSGRLFQDVAAGEISGQIHNFLMQAHIGEEGIYLAGGYWYPEPVADEDAEPSLASYTLTANAIDGMELVAGGVRDAAAEAETGRRVWQSPYPLDGMVLVGGDHEVRRAMHNGVEVSVHLRADQAEHAEPLLQAVIGYLDRYEPLIGPYPAKEFAVVDNFFSSGFAFPTFTLLSSGVINMGERSRTSHGYIDHEVLHCWWGNGVFVDPRDGNWCESLASYGANYYGFVLDGDEVQARRIRRNFVHFLARIKPEKDKPVGTYGLDDGCGRGIAYSKGAFVFHMLARTIGQDNFWQAMRDFTEKYVGKRASWEDIRKVCEQASGKSLEVFFAQWVRQGGAPLLSIDAATFNPSEQTLTLTLHQGEGNNFALEVPVRVTHAAGTLDLLVPMSEAVHEATFKLDVIPQTVEVDPDYQIFRKIPLDEILPTTSSTRTGDRFATVLPGGDVPKQYTDVQEVFETSFEEDERIVLHAPDLDVAEIADRCVLLLGDAVRDARVQAFLDEADFPVTWTDEGFSLDGTLYADPEDAVLCTVRHPGVEGGGITVVFGNSDSAVPAGFLIPFYDNSLVVFKAGKPVLRRDLEPRAIVAVQSP